MKLRDILKQEYIKAEMESRDRDAVLSELVGLVDGDVDVEREYLIRVLREREDQSPTAMSGGVAVPHGRFPELDGFILAVGKSSEGIPFGAEDGPTRIFFLLLAPTDDTVTHLKILARIARLCRKRELREDILRARESGEIYQRLIEEDRAV